jgi:hypothetical protein
MIIPLLAFIQIILVAVFLQGKFFVGWYLFLDRMWFYQSELVRGYVIFPVFRMPQRVAKVCQRISKIIFLTSVSIFS